jgi:NAD+ diphosphatase
MEVRDVKRWLLFSGDRLLLDQHSQVLWDSLPSLAPLHSLPLGRFGLFEVELLVLPPGLTEHNPHQGLRMLLAEADREWAQLLSRAAQLNSWYRNHRYCSRCGQPVAKLADDFAAICGYCDYRQYPRLSPCIIVLVSRQTSEGEQCLLAHAAHFTQDRYSTLAGFIEAGETAEQAVAREVREEVGVEVGNIRYWKSQSWPFPHSLMLAFFADYVGGELQPDGVEILKADWFSVDQLPELPPKMAISRDLIDGFVAGVHRRL